MVNKMKTIFLWLMTLMLLGSGFAYAANEYTNSAHGDTTDGVKSSSRGGPDTSDYATGNCAHCHLYQHQSLDGTPSNTPLSPQNRSDIIPFCLECHYIVQGDSAIITWNSGTIDDNDVHGDRNITGAAVLDVLDGINPDDITEVDGNYSISCIVCHEPHGTSNVMLIREEVNGAALDPITTIAQTGCTPAYPPGNKELGYLCNRCHEDDLDHYGDVAANRWYWIHHDSSDRPYSPTHCSDCHTSGGQSGHTSNRNPINCNCCHYHGSTAASRRTF